MSTLLISPVGMHAAEHDYVFTELRRIFKYDKAIFFCSNNLKERMAQHLIHIDVLVPITKQFLGVEGYEEFVVDVVRRIMDHVYYGINGSPVDLIVVNTSGGTEKMSLMFKDIMEVLRSLGDEVPTIRQVWGCAINGVAVYTEKPVLDIQGISEQFKPKQRVKVCRVAQKSHEVQDVVETTAPTSALVTETSTHLPHKKKKKKSHADDRTIADRIRREHIANKELAKKEAKERKRAEREEARQERHRLHLQGIFDERYTDI